MWRDEKKKKIMKNLKLQLVRRIKYSNKTISFKNTQTPSIRISEIAFTSHELEIRKIVKEFISIFNFYCSFCYFLLIYLNYF